MELSKKLIIVIITFIVESRDATKNIHEKSDRWLETQRNSRAKLCKESQRNKQLQPHSSLTG